MQKRTDKSFSCGRVVEQAEGIAMFAPDLADTISGMDPRSFDALSKIETEYSWFVVRNELIVGLANKLFAQARRFLEIGFATPASTGFSPRSCAEKFA
jgi:hypothetical protein